MDLQAFQRQFAARVRELRRLHRLRQEDLELFGLSWKSVQKIEYAITDPKVSTLLKLAAAFKLPLQELVTVEESTAAGERREPARPAPALHERPHGDYPAGTRRGSKRPAKRR